MKRLPIVRHIRWWLHRREFAKWWQAVGRHVNDEHPASDVQYLKDIWEGRM